MESGRAGIDDHGAHAKTPWAIPLSGWRDIVLRSWRESSDDNIGLAAAGVAFYGFLALVPLLGALVLSYGLIAEADTVLQNVKTLTSVMPSDAAKLIGDQLMNLVQSSGTKKGFGLLLALLIALFGARNGAGSIMTALNIAYEEKERRNFLWVNLTAILITAGGVAAAILAVIAIAALGHLDAIIPGHSQALIIPGKILSYVLLFLGGAAGAATLYRYAPSRERAKWVWLTPGSLFSSVGWLILTAGFGVYVAHFGSYNATYGSLAAVVVLLTWLYLSSYILLFGAELNSEVEHQTAEQTQTGEFPTSDPRDTAPPVRDPQIAPSPPTKTADIPVASQAPLARPTPTGPPHQPRVEGASHPIAHLFASRFIARAAHVAGAQKTGLVLSGTATLGLSLLRSRGRARFGAALLGATALLAWLGRDKSPVVGYTARNGASDRVIDE